MPAKPAPESVIASYRWGVFDAKEPPGVRTPWGYIIILEERAHSGAPIEWVTSYHDVNGQPKHRFTTDEQTIFQSAAQQALAVMVEIEPDQEVPDAASVIVPINGPPA